MICIKYCFYLYKFNGPISRSRNKNQINNNNNNNNNKISSSILLIFVIVLLIGIQICLRRYDYHWGTVKCGVPSGAVRSLPAAS